MRISISNQPDKKVVNSSFKFSFPLFLELSEEELKNLNSVLIKKKYKQNEEVI